MELIYTREYQRPTNGHKKGDTEEITISNCKQLVFINNYIRCFNKSGGLIVPPIPLNGIYTKVDNITIES